MMRILVSEKQGDSDSLTDSGKGPSEPGEGDKHADHKRECAADWVRAFCFAQTRN